MKHLVVGDIHGYHHNLRKFLVAHGAINKKGERINKDTLKVYSVGDLIDGEVNRQGDILNLEYASRWFDAVCIGNHEYAFLGGKEFGGRRKHDRKTMRMFLNLIDQGVYVPSTIAHGHLLTHAGLAEYFSFLNVEDANEYINSMWKMAPEIDGEISVFDWTGKDDSSYGDPTSGVFCLDWPSKRNHHFPQIVGHTTFYTGPIEKDYSNGIRHWNIDIGAKVGKGVGGVVLDEDNDTITPVFWGERFFDSNKAKKMYPPTGESMQIQILERDGKKGFLARKENGNVYRLTQPNGTKEYTGDDVKPWELSTPKSDGADIYWNEIPITDLRDIDISPLEDLEIMKFYREAVAEKTPEMRLSDLVAKGLTLN